MNTSTLMRRLNDLHDELAYLEGYASDLTPVERLERFVTAVTHIQSVRAELYGARR